MFTQVSPSLSTHTAPTNIGAQMNGNNNDHNYPVYAFPDVLRDTILELQRNIQAPIPLVANCVLNAVSLACQRLISVRRLDHLVAPVSLYTFTVADSGERKTAIDNILMKPIEEMENISLEAYKNELAIFDAKQFLWKEKKKIIASKIKDAIKFDNVVPFYQPIFDRNKEIVKYYCIENNKENLSKDLKEAIEYSIKKLYYDPLV